MARDYNFWIYIVANRNHSVLYIEGTKSALSPNLAASRRS